jgi:hypothetical protein
MILIMNIYNVINKKIERKIEQIFQISIDTKGIYISNVN